MAILGLKTAWGHLVLYLSLPISPPSQSSRQPMNLQPRELHSIHRLGGLKQHRYHYRPGGWGLQWVNRTPFLPEALGEPISFMFHLPTPPAFPGCCLQSPSLLPLLLCEGLLGSGNPGHSPCPKILHLSSKEGVITSLGSGHRHPW